jgi:hypothetical protein
LNGKDNSSQAHGSVVTNTDMPVARVLGYAGLIPFIALSISSWLPAPLGAESTDLLVLYAAIILSFMGAIHWGAALVNDTRHNSAHYTASVIPALVAWLAVLTAPPIAISLLLVSFIMLYRHDRNVNDQLGFAAWYLPLRKQLTVVVSICLSLALIASLTLSMATG